MSAYLHSNVRRLAFALAFSMLLHVLFLWLPGISLHRVHAHSSLLTVRMEPSAKQPAPAGNPEVKPRVATVRPPSHTAPKPVTPIPEKPLATTAQISVVKEIASSVVASAEASAVPSTAPVAVEQATPATDSDPKRNKQGVPPLPLHAQLRFAVYLGGSNFSIGDLFQELNIKEGRYTLQAELEKAGLASWFNSTQLTQISRGALLANGDLAPESFVEEASDARGVHHRYEAAFDWNARQLRFADGSGSTMPPGTQDMLSLQYQLSQLSMRTEKLHLAITDGNKLENILLEVGMVEQIVTPMGKLQALHMHQLHDQGAPWMDIWLGSDYHMLPVKFQKMGPDGKIAEELAIKEISVSDDQPAK